MTGEAAGFWRRFGGGSRSGRPRLSQIPVAAARLGGSRVMDFGEVIGYGRAFGRALVAIVSTFVLLLGYLWMIWDVRKQTWHDKAVSSLPIRV